MFVPMTTDMVDDEGCKIRCPNYNDEFVSFMDAKRVDAHGLTGVNPIEQI